MTYNTQPATYYENMGDGYKVCIQYCEYERNGIYCNEYLGANYPAVFCSKHTTRAK
jgi:hypothetical protein